jgi:hypothetical protein
VEAGKIDMAYVLSVELSTTGKRLGLPEKQLPVHF